MAKSERGRNDSSHLVYTEPPSSLRLVQSVMEGTYTEKVLLIIKISNHYIFTSMLLDFMSHNECTFFGVYIGTYFHAKKINM